MKLAVQMISLLMEQTVLKFIVNNALFCVMFLVPKKMLLGRIAVVLPVLRRAALVG